MISRRNFIRNATLASGALTLQFSFSCHEKLPEADLPISARFLNAYLTVLSDGTVEISNPVPEIGQGVKTALPMLVAEELDVEPDQINVIQADAGEAFGGRDQRAAGSNSVRIFWEPMRRAGATAKLLLLRAAADAWGLPPEDCYADGKGRINNRNDRRSLSYAQLAEAAARLPLPAQDEIILKDPADFRYIGHSFRNPDINALVSGSLVYGMDVRIPDMKYASIEKNPVLGATVDSFDATAALAISGVHKVFKVEGHGAAERPYCQEGVAVIGDSTWAVLQGRKALNIDWKIPELTEENSAVFHRLGQKLVGGRAGTRVRKDGDPIRQLTTASGSIEATYHLPFIAHVPMEPVNCTIHRKENSCEVWSTTQVPFADRELIGRLLEMPVENITLHVTRVGGGFGRRLGADFTIEAVKIAKEVNHPIQYFWTREDDLAFDSYRPFSYHRLSGGWDESGKINTWIHRQASTSRYAFRSGRSPHESEFFPNGFPGNLVPHFLQEYALIDTNLRRGPLRAPGHNVMAFVVESFMDELATATEVDPLAFRIDLLGEDTTFLYDEEDNNYFDTARMKAVLRLAAEKAGWGKDLPANGGMGIAGYFTFDSYVAHVAEVTVNPTDGQLDILRFTSAVDCGQVLHPDGVRAQTEGSIVDGISATLHQEITVTGGAVDQRNFHDYPVARITDAPREIEVHLVDNSYPPTGAGEPPYPPVAPALCNAIFAACGVRIRRLPVGDQLKRQLNIL